MSKTKTNIIILLLAAQIVFTITAIIILAPAGSMSRGELENRLDTVKVGIYRDYVDNLFGEPIYVQAGSGRDIAYYKLDGAALRVDYNKYGGADGYMITVTDEKPLEHESYAFFSNGGVLGETAYSAIDTHVVEANGGGNSRGIIFYAEYIRASTATNNNYIVQGYMPYGSGGSAPLFEAAKPESTLADYKAGDSLLENADFNRKRSESRPNTYGEFRYEPVDFVFSNDALRLLAE